MEEHAGEGDTAGKVIGRSGMAGGGVNVNGQARTVAESIPWIRKVMRKKNLPVSGQHGQDIPRPVSSGLLLTKMRLSLCIVGPVSMLSGICIQTC